MPRTRSRRPASPELELRRIRLDLIDVPRQRIRRDLGAVNDLAYSLGTVGILQPIQVLSVGKRYRLIAGERRLTAAGILGWQEIDALVREPRGDELLLELVENAQRKFLTDAEEADAFIRLVRDDGHQITEVGAQAGRSEAYVSKRIRVFEDPVLRDAIERQTISVSLAEEFLTVPPAERAGLLQQAIDEQWDVVRVRQAVRAPLVELQLPAPSAGDAHAASADVVDGSFRELDTASDRPAEENHTSSPVAGHVKQARARQTAALGPRRNPRPAAVRAHRLGRARVSRAVPGIVAPGARSPARQPGACVSGAARSGATCQAALTCAANS